MYLPALNAAENRYSIPPDLLARIACEESNFRDDVVNGPANRMACMGLMQLNTVFYPDAGKDWQADIITAAELLVSDFRRFNDWQLAVAAYNDGAGNVSLYLHHQKRLPDETQKYVQQIIADVYVPGCLIPPEAP